MALLAILGSCQGCCFPLTHVRACLPSLFVSQGLGTSTPKEAKEYFAALNRHRIGFYWNGDQDGDSIEMAFSKKRVEERKQWLRDFEVCCPAC